MSHSAIGAEGNLYQANAFGILGAQGSNGASSWNERVDLEKKMDDLGGFDGTREGEDVSYPYKDKVSPLKRLHALGYMQ